MFLYTLLLATSSLHIAATIDYYVIPDGEYSDDNNTHTLDYYLNYTNSSSKYFNKLNFKQREYYLKSEFILANFYNISMIGNGASIICEPNVGVTFINVTNITLENMSFINCVKYRKDYFALNYSQCMELNILTNKIYSQHASIMFYNCSLTVRNVSIQCNTGVHGIMIVNVRTPVYLSDVIVLVKFEQASNSSIISSGIFLHFYINSIVNNVSVFLINFKFVKDNDSNHKSFSFIAVKFLLLESNLSVNVSITNMTFADFHNSMGLFYYAKLHKFYGQNISLDGIQAHNNKADFPIPLFHIIFQGGGFDFKSILSCRQRSKVILHNCSFKNNTNISAIIHVQLKKTLITSTNITIHKCEVLNNINTSFVLTNSEINSLLQLTHYIKLKHVSITNNTNCMPGVSLLSFARGHAKLTGPIVVKGNSYYENIITLYFAAFRFHGHINISGNVAYMLFNTLENSYFVFEKDVRVDITNNTFHSNIRKTGWIDNNYLEYMGFYDNAKVCLIQFYSSKENLDDEFARDKNKLNYTLFLSKNRITQPHYLTKDDFGLNSNCSWLGNMAFKNITPLQVMQAFIKPNDLTSTKEDVYRIPSKICYCTSNNTYNCTKREVGPVFPGQLLKLSLVVPSLNSSTVKRHYQYIMLTATVHKNGCIIENVSEIFQLHKNHSCNEYKYIIKYHTFHECQLYLRTQEHDTEILYVELKPCPAGFVLESDMCVCDPLLKSEPVLLSSCHLDDETILRPKNSWITAETNAFDYSHTYFVSLHCPLQYCLPHSSHLNLSDPDSQCQFNRTGVLCTQCQKGLSAVFGSPHCKHCTNYYLLIIVPFFIVTFLLMLLIFLFNLTITDGGINIFIFYVDIVGINISKYFPRCHSVLCMFAPSDKIETCFYNGMDNYAKMWLHLSYPLYLILIAVLLIILSRYSVIFQRLTAQRALPVLATLFLLSFTGLLRTVSLVLFYFKTVTRIPGKHTTLVWGVDTSVLLHEPKFIVLYIVCIIFFFILLIFNALLLFTKELLRFKTINKIKPLLDVYLGPYKYGFSYWTGLQLLIRTATFGLTAIDRDMNLMMNSILLVVLLWIQGIVQPFKSKFHNFQQSLVLLDIIVINIITLYNRGSNSQAFKVVSIIIYAVSLYFVAYIIFHCVIHAFGKIINKSKTAFMICFAIWKQKITSKKKIAEITRMASVKRKVGDVTYNYQEFQEPLIEID